jgi:menaquinone-dependent protoporphyrinogen IX oxidase/Fe-S-cluster-containing hydrogenase component 2
MKGIVIYHSMTGNTKKIAEAIHRGMNKTGEACDIARLQDIKIADLAQYDLIGLGSPVLHLRELRNVTNFIEQTLKHVDGKHGFAFCTHGAFPAHYLSRVVPAMIQRGLTVIGWKDWFCSVFHPGCPKPYFTDGHPDAIDLKEAEDFGQEMVERSRRIYKGETGLVPTLPRGAEYDEIYDPYPQPHREILAAFQRAQAQMNLKVNKEKCLYPKCTHCIDICPMRSINFTVDPPVFNIDCDRCWLCEQTCPRGAIEVDWTDYKKTHRPMVDDLVKSLEIFEKRGRFRRLVKNEDIGWDNFVCDMKHPKFKAVQ